MQNELLEYLGQVTLVMALRYFLKQKPIANWAIL